MSIILVKMSAYFTSPLFTRFVRLVKDSKVLHPEEQSVIFSYKISSFDEVPTRFETLRKNFRELV